MSNTAVTRLAIVGCHPVVDRGLRDVLDAERDMEVVCECPSSEECFEVLDSVTVDVLVIDLTSAGLCGLHSLEKALNLWKGTPVVVLSDYVGCCRLALQVGAHGFVSTEDNESDIVHVVRSVATGTVCVGEHDLDHLVTTEFRAEQSSADAELSVRDILMLDLMSRGFSLREIATHLHVTPKTVRSYRHQLEEKLEASTVNELVLKAGRALRATPLDA